MCDLFILVFALVVVLLDCGLQREIRKQTSSAIAGSSRYRHCGNRMSLMLDQLSASIFMCTFSSQRIVVSFDNFFLKKLNSKYGKESPNMSCHLLGLKTTTVGAMQGYNNLSHEPKSTLSGSSTLCTSWPRKSIFSYVKYFQH